MTMSIFFEILGMTLVVLLISMFYLQWRITKYGPVYKVGDRVLAREVFGGYFTAHIEVVSKDWRGTYYLANWTVNSDLSGRYSKLGELRPWHIRSHY